MWVLFDIVYFNVSHLSWFLDLALVVTLWPTLVMGEVAVGGDVFLCRYPSVCCGAVPIGLLYT